MHLETTRGTVAFALIIAISSSNPNTRAEATYRKKQFSSETRKCLRLQTSSFVRMGGRDVPMSTASLSAFRREWSSCSVSEIIKISLNFFWWLATATPKSLVLCFDWTKREDVNEEFFLEYGKYLFLCSRLDVCICKWNGGHGFCWLKRRCVRVGVIRNVEVLR